MGRYIVLGQCCMVGRALLLPKVVMWFAVTPRWDLGLNVTSAKMFARLEQEMWFHSTCASHMIEGVCNTLGDAH